MLENYPETRNSDIALTIKIWEEFYSNILFDNPMNGVKSVELRSLFELPREDNIKRCRAHWQNDKKMFLSTELKIALKRGILEDEWRVAIGYPTKETAGNPVPSWTPLSEIGQSKIQ